MSTIVQQAFTNEIRNIGLDPDTKSTNLQRISASGAIIREAQEPHLKDLVNATGTVRAKEHDDYIRINFDHKIISLSREHEPYISARENKSLWQITQIGPNEATNCIIATVEPTTIQPWRALIKSP
jgi:hypothetical protein